MLYVQENEDGEMDVVYIDPFAVGKKISTKCIGSNYRHDLTGEYKYPDGNRFFFFYTEFFFPEVMHGTRFVRRIGPISKTLTFWFARRLLETVL